MFNAFEHKCVLSVMICLTICTLGYRTVYGTVGNVANGTNKIEEKNIKERKRKEINWKENKLPQIVIPTK